MRLIYYSTLDNIGYIAQYSWGQESLAQLIVKDELHDSAYPLIIVYRQKVKRGVGQ